MTTENSKDRNGVPRPRDGIYTIQQDFSDNSLEGFAFVDNHSLVGNDRLVFDFTPNDAPELGRDWKAVRLADVWFPREVVGNVPSFHDYPCVNLTIPAFSERAVLALSDFLQDNGELLPLVSPSGRYFAYNVTTVADVLDWERSKIQWLKGFEGKFALRILQHEFYASRTEHLSIFHIVESVAGVYVTQRFVDRVRDAELCGFRFDKVWPQNGD